MVMQNQKQRGHKRQHFCANACEYLRYKQVEVTKVFKLTKENIEFGRSVEGKKKKKIYIYIYIKSLIYRLLLDGVLY